MATMMIWGLNISSKNRKDKVWFLIYLKPWALTINREMILVLDSLNPTNQVSVNYT